MNRLSSKDRDDDGYNAVKILLIVGIVVGAGLIAWVKYVPFFISKSRFGVIEVFVGPKHLSDLKESIKINRILGFNNYWSLNYEINLAQI